MLDHYNTEDRETPDKAFDLLISSVKLLGIGEDHSVDGIEDFIKGIDSGIFSSAASSVLDILKECFDPYPVLAYLYPRYYSLLRLLCLYSEKSLSFEETVSQFSHHVSALLKELRGINSAYEQAKGYTRSVLIEPYAESASIITRS